MHQRAPGEYLRGKDRQRGVLAAIRQHLKKANYHNFDDLVQAFRFYDKVCLFLNKPLLFFLVYLKINTL